ncbi:MAG: gliding motility-associated C-terminal domain-containing protein [Bacteroidales bacterium]|nr:gliding motility-associated C-terminal domain-containing protein [Bacteroidales bacterium]
MVKKKKDSDLLDLFKDNLENSEITPSSSVLPTVMRKVKVKEFFSFIPSKFNIWYVAEFAAVAVASGLIFSSIANRSYNKAVPDWHVPSTETTVEEKIVVPQESNTIIESLPVITVPEIVPDEEKPVVTSHNNNSPNESTTRNKEEEVVQPSKISPEPVVKQMESKDIPMVSEKRENTIRSTKAPLFSPSVTIGCAPLKVSFKLNGDVDGTYKWTFGDGGFSFDKEPDWLFDEAGTFTVNLKVVGDVDVIAEYSTEITVYPKPIARFESSNENVLLPDEEVSFLNYSSGAVEYEWSFGDGPKSDVFEPTHKYDKYDEYDVRLIAISEYGCVDSLEISNMFASSAYYIKFPNVFRPNAGGQSGGYYVEGSIESNEVFHPVAYGVASYQLRIYNRIGVLLFESNSIDIGWDGYYRNRLCDPGVYVWKVRVTYLNGQQDIKVGDVTILNDNMSIW